MDTINFTLAPIETVTSGTTISGACVILTIGETSGLNQVNLQGVFKDISSTTLSRKIYIKNTDNENISTEIYKWNAAEKEGILFMYPNELTAGDINTYTLDFDSQSAYNDDIYFISSMPSSYYDSVIFDVTPNWLETYVSGTLTPWANRIRIDIPNTNITTTLVNFPVLLNLSDSSGQSNTNTTSIVNYTVNNQIAITTDDGTTQLPVELENYELQNDKVLKEPYGYSTTYMTSTDRFSDLYYTHFAFDPSLSLVDDDTNCSWVSSTTAELRLNVGYPRPFICNMIRIRNYHKSGTGTTRGIKNFIFYGSNENILSNVTYNSLTDLTELGTFEATTHVSENIDDYTDYYLSNNTMAFQYYSFMLVDNWGSESYIGVRRIGLYKIVESANAQLWTKVPVLKPYDTTSIYLYYDDTVNSNTQNVGDIGSYVGSKVWDENFVSVLHLNKDCTETVLNSCGTLNGTGVGITAGNTVDSYIGYGLSLDGLSDYLNLDSLMPYITEDFTWEISFNSVDDSWTPWIASYTSGGVNSLILNCYSDGSPRLLISSELDTTYAYNTKNGSWYYLCTNLDNATGKMRLFFEDTDVTEDTAGLSETTISERNNEDGLLAIGMDWDGTTESDYVDGIIKEIRISNNVRTPNWIKATYYATRDNLVIYNSAESYVPEEDQNYYFHGYTTLNGNPDTFKMFLYNRETGVLKDTVDSNSEGYYVLNTNTQEEHFIVAYNDTYIKINDKLVPNGE